MSWEIKLERLATTGIIGVYRWERKQEQTLYVSLVLTADLAAAAEQDDVALTIDYQEVANAVHEVVAAREAKLIEHLAKQIADQLMARFPITAVEVQVDKPDAVPGTSNIAVRYCVSA